MSYKFNILEDDNVAIIYYYKIGSRYVENYFSDSTTRVIYYPSFSETPSDNYPKDIKIGNYYLDSNVELKTSLIHQILTNKLVPKKLIFLYRNPYEKTISGLTEDFHEEIIRHGNAGHVSYIDRNEFIRYLNQFNYSENDLNILSSSFKDMDTRTTLEILETTSSVTLEELYFNILKLYSEYRIDIGEIGIGGHTEFYIQSCYKLISILHKDQDYTLLNLDDSTDNLFVELSKYHTPIERPPIKNDFSNKGYKEVLTQNLSDSSKKKLLDILETNFGFYNLLEQIRKKKNV